MPGLGNVLIATVAALPLASTLPPKPSNPHAASPPPAWFGPTKPRAAHCGHGDDASSYWQGWESITHMFTFGDSYTTTGFNLSLTQPNRDNPLGNPAYPGYTATNGPNWVDFLTRTYNATFLQTINLASGGATVDSALIPPYQPTVRSLRDQVLDQFLPVYADAPASFPWQPNTTLFATWLGINDVGNAYAQPNSSALSARVFNVYARLMATLYQHGARNFLLLNVPPVDRSPLTQAAGPAAAADEAAAIAAWNANVTALAANLRRNYPDAATFVFDTHALFGAVLDAPCAYPQTCPYRNTTAYCESYADGTPAWDSFDPSCGIPVDEYFWLNSLHPTYRMMNVTAQEIAAELRGPGGRERGRGHMSLACAPDWARDG